MQRDPELQNFIDNFAKKTFGRDTTDPGCIFCGSTKITKQDFRDDLSRKEFNISHICQKCQDKIFK